MNESQLCSEMMGNFNAPDSRTYRVSLHLNETGKYELAHFCVYGWAGSVFYKQADISNAIDRLFQMADQLGLPWFASHNRTLTFYRF